MPVLDVAQIGLYLALLVAATPLLGGYMARVFAGEINFLRPVEVLLYRAAGVNANAEMRWPAYAAALLAFNALGFGALFILQLTQGSLPLNPAQLPNVGGWSAFNTAVSFMTNTNWQGYAGETTMSTLTQMMGLAVQNFVSAATGIAVKLALVAVLAPSASILIFAPLAAVTDVGQASLLNRGPHGLSEILYAFSSAANNNGSAFAGLNANTDFYNGLLGVAMLIGRFAVILPALAIAGGMAGKKVTPLPAGTFTPDTALFVVLLIAVVLIIGALTFFPALSLGLIVEHFLALSGRGF